MADPTTFQLWAPVVAAAVGGGLAVLGGYFGQKWSHENTLARDFLAREDAAKRADKERTLAKAEELVAALRESRAYIRQRLLASRGAGPEPELSNGLDRAVALCAMHFTWLEKDFEIVVTALNNLEIFVGGHLFKFQQMTPEQKLEGPGFSAEEHKKVTALYKALDDSTNRLVARLVVHLNPDVQMKSGTLAQPD